MNGFEHWALTGAIFAPVIGAAVVGLAPRRAEAAIKSGALLSSLVSLGFVVYLMVRSITRLGPKKAEAPATTKDCPYCLSKIPLKAVKCAFCGTDLTGRT